VEEEGHRGGGTGFKEEEGGEVDIVCTDVAFWSCFGSCLFTSRGLVPSFICWIPKCINSQI